MSGTNRAILSSIQAKNGSESALTSALMDANNQVSKKSPKKEDKKK